MWYPYHVNEPTFQQIIKRTMEGNVAKNLVEKNCEANYNRVSREPGQGPSSQNELSKRAENGSLNARSGLLSLSSGLRQRLLRLQDRNGNLETSGVVVDNCR